MAAARPVAPMTTAPGNGGADGGGNGDPAPPPLPPSSPDGMGAGESQTLLGYVHSSYLLSIAREKAVRDLKRWLLMRFWFFLSAA